MGNRVLIAGASGFLGRLLTVRLAQQGYRVIAVSRRAPALPALDGIESRALDISDQQALKTALVGIEAAYYLVHSMDSGKEFVERDLALARGFAQACAEAGVGRIIYQGALGGGSLSPHLASRQQVGRELAAAGIPVVELRAAVVLGSGSTSFEMLRYLTERLPLMICPKWVRTQTEPIAVSDVLEYLVRSLDAVPGVYEIGCGDVTSYQDMMHIYSQVRGLRRRPILNVPLLSLHLSGYWVDLITPLDRRVTHTLIESMSTSVTVQDAERTRSAFGIEPLSLRAALQHALDDQAQQVPEGMFEHHLGPAENLHWVYEETEVEAEVAGRIREDLSRIGGDLAWYGWPWAWRLRFLLGMLVGEKHPVTRPETLNEGESADWWVVDRVSAGTLVLRAAGWKTGEGWLGYRLPEDSQRLQVAAAFRPRGVPGFLYWFLLTPLHRRVFKALVRARVRRAAAVRSGP